MLAILGTALITALLIVALGYLNWWTHNDNRIRMREIHLIHLQETRKDAKENRRFLRQMDAHIAMILERIDHRNS